VRRQRIERSARIGFREKSRQHLFRIAAPERSCKVPATMQGARVGLAEVQVIGQANERVGEQEIALG